MALKIYTVNDHDGYYPVGAASVIVASDEQQARALLDAALRERKLDPSKGYTLQRLVTTKPGAHILLDGNY